MRKIARLPESLRIILGNQGSIDFIEFFNEISSDQQEEIIPMVVDRFDRRITEEVSQVRVQISDFKYEIELKISEFRSEIEARISELRTEMNTRFSEVDVRFSEIHTKFAELRMDLTGQIQSLRAELKSDIASQTRWILVSILAATVLMPLTERLLSRLLP